MSAGSCFVLCPGTWMGAWVWRRTADALRERGARAVPITYSGVGARREAMAGEIDLDRMARDVAAEMEAEELSNVTLVGHSFGGAVASAVSALATERLRRIVYLDAALLPSGAAMSSILPPAIWQGLEHSAQGGPAIPPLPALPPDWADSDQDRDWLLRRMTPHPLASYTSPCGYDEAAWRRLPRTYIACTAVRSPEIDAMRATLREAWDGEWRELASGHLPMVTQPAELARLLLSL